MSDEQETLDPLSPPDFMSPSEVARWFGQQVIELVNRAKREKALSRLRSLSSAMDSWSKLYRLASDSEELHTLRHELDELRSLVEQSTRSGPTGVVRDD